MMPLHWRILRALDAFVWYVLVLPWLWPLAWGMMRWGNFGMGPR